VLKRLNKYWTTENTLVGSQHLCTLGSRSPVVMCGFCRQTSLSCWERE